VQIRTAGDDTFAWNKVKVFCRYFSSQDEYAACFSVSGGQIAPLEVVEDEGDGGKNNWNIINK